VTGDKLLRARALNANGLTVPEAATRLKIGETALYQALRNSSDFQLPISKSGHGWRTRIGFFTGILTVAHLYSRLHNYRCARRPLLRRVAITLAVSGCNRSPTIDLLGSYFPAWMQALAAARYRVGLFDSAKTPPLKSSHGAHSADR
jgi:hypothetical protein